VAIVRAIAAQPAAIEVVLIRCGSLQSHVAELAPTTLTVVYGRGLCQLELFTDAKYLVHKRFSTTYRCLVAL
jgi:hypothetical protein